VVLVEGDYHYCVNGRNGARKEGVLRIALNETGMGMASADIITREMIAYTKKFPVGTCQGMVQIRVGTAGGINTMDAEAPEVKRGDLVIATTNVGFSGTVLQSFGYTPIVDLSKVTKEAVDQSKKFMVDWESLGGSITRDGKYLVNYNSKSVVSAAVSSAENLGISAYAGGCFSKDSLYMEGDEKTVAELREKYLTIAANYTNEKNQIIATEMEQLANAAVAIVHLRRYGHRVFTGAVLAIIGALPGEGFPEDGNKNHARQAAKAEKNAIIVAADALATFKERLNDSLCF
jgi:uridine phosphorylase